LAVKKNKLSLASSLILPFFPFPVLANIHGMMYMVGNGGWPWRAG
jgi:hypothetical protein